MTRTLLRFSSFAFVLLWAIAAQAESASREISFSDTSTRRATFGLAREAPLNFISKKIRREDFNPVDGEEVLGKIRWLELMSCNYIGHDPTQLRHYGPIGREFLAALAEDGTNSRDTAGTLMIDALKKRAADLTKVRAENAEFEIRIGTPGRLALSIKLLFD